jgi:DNA-binding LacI/PurR family transcriptional regulator
LKTAGIDTDDNLSVDAEPSEQAGREAVEELVRRGARFDAVFAASDVAAIGAMHALQKLGRAIPEEVAIVGFDDIPAASLSSPPLSTVRQDSRRAGEALVEAAVEAVEYGNLQTLLLPVKLIVRESSRPA